jgi:hypothetical protein
MELPNHAHDAHSAILLDLTAWLLTCARVLEARRIALPHAQQRGTCVLTRCADGILLHAACTPTSAG